MPVLPWGARPECPHAPFTKDGYKHTDTGHLLPDFSLQNTCKFAVRSCCRCGVVYALVADNVPRLLLSPLLGDNQRVMNARIGFSRPRSACLVSSRTHRPHAISPSSGSAPAYTACG